MEIAQSIVWTVFEWVSKRKEFVGASLDNLNGSWAPYLEGSCHDKVV